MERGRPLLAITESGGMPTLHASAQIAKLVDAGEVDSSYFVEYTVQKSPSPTRHLYSRLSLGYNGMYNRLYTITGQALDSDYDKYKSTLLAVIKSLKTPKGQTI